MPRKELGSTTTTITSKSVQAGIISAILLSLLVYRIIDLSIITYEYGYAF